MTQEEIFVKLVSYLNKLDLNYRILGDYRRYPEIHSDIDFVCDNFKKFQIAISDFAMRNNLVLFLEKIHGSGYRYNLISQDDCFVFPGPDVLLFPTVNFNISKLSVDRIFKYQYSFYKDLFKIPPPDINFVFYFIKKIDKMFVNEENFDFLVELYLQASQECEKLLKEILPSQIVNQIVEDLRSGNFDMFKKRVPLLFDFFRKKSSFSLKRTQFNIMRYAYRLIRNKSLVIAFLGPDGVGKSTIIKHLTQELKIFSNKKVFHLKPRVLDSKRSKKKVVYPHAVSSHNTLKSYMKLLYFATDYIVGYPLKILPLKLRSTLILFDRYYDDILVDPKRYRYSGKLRFARWLRGLIPKPDIYIVLIADPKVIYRRKQEVEFSELERQIKEYEKLVDNKKYFKIDASKSLDEVVRDILKIILTKLRRNEI